MCPDELINNSMPHGGHCHDEAHDHDHNHGHDKDGSERGDEFSLWRFIDIDNVRCLNEAEDGTGKKVLKPWDERLDTSKFVESDVDEQLILYVPFTGSIKLKSIAVRGGPGNEAPSRMKVDHIDFDMAETTVATQDFELVNPTSSDMVIEYPTRVAKFNQVRSVALYFSENFSVEMTRLYYVGFKGEWSEVKSDPVITLYEAAPNPADHATESETLQKSSFA